ncbi:hypothetical protein BC939DRAFT_450003 [Gamsiella multidivaricata]|uniref:uncharacterized protein n=1 Tax=Gamsiella multidivaricata TaxID=101098 RepID=UPI00221EB576|nr:uncharacterized protein BC939DRAFT_450003 [Gamsiella multidivaricata]KAI7824313.1 hypothetical protein BC939DRAFT_450003 [Gamsiella multidivaricata]
MFLGTCCTAFALQEDISGFLYFFFLLNIRHFAISFAANFVHFTNHSTMDINDLRLILVPMCVIEALPLVLVTVIYEAQILRYLFFNGPSRPVPPHKSVDSFALLPWKTPKDASTRLGSLIAWVCGIVWFFSEFTLDLVLIALDSPIDDRSVTPPSFLPQQKAKNPEKQKRNGEYEGFEKETQQPLEDRSSTPLALQAVVDPNHLNDLNNLNDLNDLNIAEVTELREECEEEGKKADHNSNAAMVADNNVNDKSVWCLRSEFAFESKEKMDGTEVHSKNAPDQNLHNTSGREGSASCTDGQSDRSVDSISIIDEIQSESILLESWTVYPSEPMENGKAVSGSRSESVDLTDDYQDQDGQNSEVDIEQAQVDASVVLDDTMPKRSPLFAVFDTRTSAMVSMDFGPPNVDTQTATASALISLIADSAAEGPAKASGQDNTCSIHTEPQISHDSAPMLAPENLADIQGQEITTAFQSDVQPSPAAISNFTVPIPAEVASTTSTDETIIDAVETLGQTKHKTIHAADVEHPVESLIEGFIHSNTFDNTTIKTSVPPSRLKRPLQVRSLIRSFMCANPTPGPQDLTTYSPIRRRSPPLCDAQMVLQASKAIQTIQPIFDLSEHQDDDAEADTNIRIATTSISGYNSEASSTASERKKENKKNKSKNKKNKKNKKKKKAAPGMVSSELESPTAEGDQLFSAMAVRSHSDK